MTEQYLAWFDKYINKPYFTKEEKEDLLVYRWMAWRDSRREVGHSENSEKLEMVLKETKRTLDNNSGIAQAWARRVPESLRSIDE